MAYTDPGAYSSKYQKSLEKENKRTLSGKKDIG